MGIKNKNIINLIKFIRNRVEPDEKKTSFCGKKFCKQKHKKMKIDENKAPRYNFFLYSERLPTLNMFKSLTIDTKVSQYFFRINFRFLALKKILIY